VHQTTLKFISGKPFYCYTKVNKHVIKSSLHISCWVMMLIKVPLLFSKLYVTYLANIMH